MSSDLQSTYKALLLNDYISLIGCIIVGYDYILTFSREIDYVWSKRWTWVSVIFVVVRYPGLCWAFLNGLIGSTFIPGPLEMYVHQFAVVGIRISRRSAGTVLFLVSCWAFPVFICAADLVMVLRVYTMWARSKTILYTLLFFYMLQLITAVVFPAIYNSSPVYFIPTTIQVFNFTVCSGSFIPSVPVLLGVYCAIPRFLISAALLILAVARTLKQSVEMYNATKQWQPNRYMNLFVRDGIYYFFIVSLYNFLVAITATPAIQTPPVVVNILITLSTSLLCCSMPRFIITVRELYDRDLRGSWRAIDTGFGAASRGIAHGKKPTSTIAFADAGQEESRTLQGDGDAPGTFQLETIVESSRHA